MNLRKFQVFVALFASIALSQEVLAVPAAPSPTCRLEGTIVESVYYASHFREDDGRPCNSGGREISARHIIDFQISSVSVLKEAGGVSCAVRYPVGETRKLTLLGENLQESLVLAKGTKMKGTVHFSGDECQSGHYLKEFEALSKTSP